MFQLTTFEPDVVYQSGDSVLKCKDGILSNGEYSCDVLENNYAIKVLRLS